MSADISQAEVTDEQFQESLAFVRQYLSDNYPNLDLQPTRVLHDLLVEPGSTIHALNQANMARLQSSQSLLDINNDPTLADDAIVDKVLSNYRITRLSGQPARGNVVIVLSTQATTVVPEGAEFEGNGLTYQATQTFISVETTPENATERLMTERSDGTYAFTITVEAVETGEQYNVKQGTRLAWTQPSTLYVDSFAEADFAGGEDTETNAQLLARLQNGFATNTIGGRANIRALISETHPTTSDTSIIGYGDPEMLRDGHSIFGLKTGGKADFYPRTSKEILTKRIQKQCVLIDADTGLFQTSIGRNDYPGFYDVQAVYPEDENEFLTGLEVTSFVKGLDFSDLSYPEPDVEGIVEGAYSRFQTAVIQFLSPTTDVDGLVEGESLVTFQVDLTGMPLIGDIQDFISGRGVRNPAGDYLVRAPIPFFVAVTMEIDYYIGDEAVDVDAVKQAVVDAVNTVGFNLGRVSAARLIDAAHDQITGRASVRSPINMVGKLLMPDGTTRTYSDSYSLDVPDIFDQSVSPRTVGVYTTLDSVSVTVNTVSADAV